MTAYNRGQVLYRVAEVMEGRRVQFCEEVSAGEGLSAGKARAAVDAGRRARRSGGTAARRLPSRRPEAHRPR
jgi:hypothetical protein